MENLGQKLEVIIGCLLVLFLALALEAEFNKSVYGTRWPIFNLFKRLLDTKTRAKALKDLFLALIFVVLLVVGSWLIACGVKNVQGS
ncbi:MAG: hypothetical protein V1716_02285 [Candidatus Uhrbacteria bacterium]